jgi:hypothetical protein
LFLIVLRICIRLVVAHLTSQKDLFLTHVSGFYGQGDWDQKRGLFSQTATGGRGSMRLREASIMPQVIGLSRSIKLSIDQATATPRLAIVAKS